MRVESGNFRTGGFVAPGLLIPFPMSILTWDSPGLVLDAPGLTWDGETPNPQPTSYMSLPNRISATLSDADKATVLAAIQTIRTKLPFLVGLDDAARKELPRLGPKTVGYDMDCQAAMTARPDLIPSFVNQPELAKDRALWAPLGEILTELSALCGAAQDSFDILGSEIFDADRAFHANVREASKRGMAGAKTIYDQIKVRFPGRPRGSSGAGSGAGGGGGTGGN